MLLSCCVLLWNHSCHFLPANCSVLRAFLHFRTCRLGLLYFHSSRGRTVFGGWILRSLGCLHFRTPHVIRRAASLLPHRRASCAFSWGGYCCRRAILRACATIHFHSAFIFIGDRLPFSSFTFCSIHTPRRGLRRTNICCTCSLRQRAEPELYNNNFLQCFNGITPGRQTTAQTNRYKRFRYHRKVAERYQVSAQQKQSAHHRYRFHAERRSLSAVARVALPQQHCTNALTQAFDIQM